MPPLTEGLSISTYTTPPIDREEKIWKEEEHDKQK